MTNVWISATPLFVIQFYLKVFFTLCANKDLKRGLKLCLALTLQSLQPKLQLCRQSTDPLASSIKGENALLVGDLQRLHRKCRITLDLCSELSSCKVSVVSGVWKMKWTEVVEGEYEALHVCICPSIPRTLQSIEMLLCCLLNLFIGKYNCKPSACRWENGMYI